MTGQDSGVPFDVIGARYEEIFGDRPSQREAGQWLIDRLPAGAAVLDLGCGSGGPTARQLVDAGLAVVGIDESERMLELARQRVPGGRFVRRDLRELDGDLGEFDAAVAFFSLLMLPRADIADVLRRTREVLRGPGLLVLSMVYGDIDDMPISFLGVPMRATAYPMEELCEVVGAAGFRVLQRQELDVPGEPGRMERWLFVFASAEDGDG